MAADKTRRSVSKGDRHVTFRKHRLRHLVAVYKSRNRPNVDQLLSGFRQLESLDTAVRIAASGLGPNGKRHPHQRRLKQYALDQATLRLLRARNRIAMCRSFDALIRLVRERTREVKGFGELAVYDTALRIGAFKRLAPTRAYLHAGARQGAHVLGLIGNRGSLDPTECPVPLSTLRAHEIEDFLCVYKDQFGGSSAQPRSTSRLRPICDLSANVGAHVQGTRAARTLPVAPCLEASMPSALRPRAARG
jgi:hypothetical protein